MGQNPNPPVYVLVSEKAGVALKAMEKYVKYVSRTVTTVHAGTRSAHSLINVGEIQNQKPKIRNQNDGGGGGGGWSLRWPGHVHSTSRVIPASQPSSPKEGGRRARGGRRLKWVVGKTAHTHRLGYQVTPSHMIHSSGRIAQRKYRTKRRQVTAHATKP